jgi:acyl carrier protein
MADIKNQVKEYILDNLLMGGTADEINDHVSFLDMEIIDSTGIIELVSFLEDAFRISVDDEEIVPENMDSLINIEKYVLGKITTV